MLEIKNISKTYKTGDLVQTALKGVSLNLRDNEFVSILGPSGSGKTTLLNIIGGLDRYDEGDLVINHVSTKKYKDRDWDAYRNHTIGFVFQSYNLIPHQTVLANVELALTISGISGKERKRRALEALKQVGLEEQAHKKPNQMSGGQMQRVAIARALVNNPDILLADEPTGALDTKTSVQVMDLLKSVAKDRLVVMVSHNPELAEQYSTRIVKIKDGEIISDSDPYLVIDENETSNKRLGKAHMGFLTALTLSFNNLLSKKGRTILTAFAGSIGIIGIALILALSTGFQNYIDDIQEDTMSSYPLTIQSETANIFSALLSAHSDGEASDDSNKVTEQMMITSMMNSVGSNDLKSFKSWLEDNEDLYANDVSEISYSYSVSPLIYTKDVTNSYVQLNPNTLMSSIYSDSASSLLSSISSSSSMGTFAEYDMDKVKDETELIAGRYPQNYNELIIVLSDKGKISDLLVYTLGLRDNAELKTLISEVMGGDEVTIENEPMTFTYEDLMNVKMKLINASDLYKYNSKYDTYEDMSDDDEYLENVYNNSEDLNIVGVAYTTDSDSTMAGVIYQHSLVQHVIDLAKESPIVQKQLANKDLDVFSGKNFDDENDEDTGLDFNDMVTVDEDKLKDAFKINITEDDFIKLVDEDEIKKLALKAQDDANTSVKQISAGIASLEKTYFEYKLKIYELGHLTVAGTDSGILSLSDFEPYFSNTTLTTVKSDFETLKALDSTGQLSSAITGFGLNDEDYTNIASATKSYLTAYFLELTEGKHAYDNTSETIAIKYSINGTDPTTIKITEYGENKITKDSEDNDVENKTITYDDLITAVFKNEEGNNYLAAVSNRVIASVTSGLAAKGSAEGSASTAKSILVGLGDLFGDDVMTVDTDAFADAFNFDMDEDELTRLMESMLTSSSASYSNNLIDLGYQDIDDPTSISIYFNDFDSKEHFLTVIDDYNSQVDNEDKEITYTDITGMLISSVQTIVNAVTYVLIAFVSISLVVSSIMIAVITLISVMERTKEIGILRAMGASKRNVSSIFNAETFIIGLLSGTIGVVVSYLATFPINNLIYKLTEIDNLKAVLSLKPAIILVIISVVLTMLAGFIPSKKAAKQDPVIALRSE